MKEDRGGLKKLYDKDYTQELMEDFVEIEVICLEFTATDLTDMRRW